MPNTMIFKLLLIAISIDSTLGLSCKDESNLDVPTWTIMKLPQGTNYYYYDTNTGYNFSQHSLNNTSTGSMTYTMNQLWEPNMQYIIYNDESPHQVEYNFSVAHSKGVIMWDNTNAIIITHSIPKFPQGPTLTGEYTGLMENAWDYGQAAACFQVSLSALPDILNQVYEMNPLIYEKSCTNCYESPKKSSHKSNKITTQLNDTIPCSTYIIDGSRVMFMKPSSAKVDIWASCIAPYFGSPVSVESWIHGSMDEAYCPPNYPFETVDIQSLYFLEGQNFTEYEDHSKWGILQEPLVCFGDLNRVTSQLTRAGSVYCWKDTTLWAQLNNLIVSTNGC